MEDFMSKSLTLWAVTFPGRYVQYLEAILRRLGADKCLSARDRSFISSIRIPSEELFVSVNGKTSLVNRIDESDDPDLESTRVFEEIMSLGPMTSLEEAIDKYLGGDKCGPS